MSDGTTLLFALPGYRVLDVALESGGGRVVLIESTAAEGGCPACGVLSGLVKERPTSRVKDLPHGLVPLRVWVRKRRFRCAEPLCPRCGTSWNSPGLASRNSPWGPLVQVSQGRPPCRSVTREWGVSGGGSSVRP